MTLIHIKVSQLTKFYVIICKTGHHCSVWLNLQTDDASIAITIYLPYHASGLFTTSPLFTKISFNEFSCLRNGKKIMYLVWWTYKECVINNRENKAWPGKNRMWDSTQEWSLMVDTESSAGKVREKRDRETAYWYVGMKNNTATELSVCFSNCSTIEASY